MSTYYQFLMVGKRESSQLSIFTVISNNNNIEGNNQHEAFAMGQVLFYMLYLFMISIFLKSFKKCFIFF